MVMVGLSLMGFNLVIAYLNGTARIKPGPLRWHTRALTTELQSSFHPLVEIKTRYYKLDRFIIEIKVGKFKTVLLIQIFIRGNLPGDTRDRGGNGT